MVITENIDLPTDEQLNIQEVNLSYSTLRAAAFHLGKYCELQNNEFMLCKEEEKDPRRCLNEGKIVTDCTLNFFTQIKKHCKEELNQYNGCIHKSMRHEVLVNYCRKSESMFNTCVLNNLKIEKPPVGYFSRIIVHDTSRPKPEINIVEYPDAVPRIAGLNFWSKE